MATTPRGRRGSMGDGPAVVFGDLRIPAPTGTRLVAVYQKPSDAGYRSVAGFRRDAEAIYLLNLPAGYGGRSSVITTGASKEQLAQRGACPLRPPAR